MTRVIIAVLLAITLTGCERGQYYDTGPILVDKQLIRGPNTYPEKSDGKM